MSITGHMPTNWFEAYPLVKDAMKISSRYALDCITATSDEVSTLIIRGRRIVKDAFEHRNSLRRNARMRLPKPSAKASVILRFRIDPSEPYQPNPLLD
jgi:hypothetical protein